MHFASIFSNCYDYYGNNIYNFAGTFRYAFTFIFNVGTLRIILNRYVCPGDGKSTLICKAFTSLFIFSSACKLWRRYTYRFN